MTRPAASRLTYDDFLRFPDDGRRHELIDGEHHVTPSPSLRHQRVSRDLLYALHGHCRATAQAEVFVAPLDVILSRHDVVEPDLLVVLADQPGLLAGIHVRGAPAIVVEILSPGTRARDEAVKRRLYERVGVREYWLVDPDEDTIRVAARSAAGGFAVDRDLSAAADDTLTSPLLPGFRLVLRDLFVRPSA